MKKILVVDDEKNIRLTLSQALETLGMPVQTAGDGEEALKKLQDSDFNLVLERQDQEGEGLPGYQRLIDEARHRIREGMLESAWELTRRAVAADPARAEAYNLLGALMEIKHDRLEAQRFYRAALEIDPTYRPAGENLERITSRHRIGSIDLGEGGEKQ